ncbi:MAG: inositol monophosphatase family protein [Candidatus Nanohaloarchaea archaeon]|nr:inositol monophosphatase family protein [Candidatus Nanohaloarchaea archaeon]
MSLGYELEKAEEAVRDAGKLIKDIRSKRIPDSIFKQDGTPATLADKKAEELIRDRLFKEFPEYGFKGEELADVKSDNRYRWLCDPIDGTWSYINGENTVSVSLALEEDGDTVLGIVYHPFSSDFYAGAEGIDPTMNGREMPVFDAENLSDQVVNFKISKEYSKQIEGLYDRYRNGCFGKLVKQGGSIAHSLAQVAEGRHSSFLSYTGRPTELWDVAAGMYLVRSAGGRMTDLENKPVDGKSQKVMVASTNETVHSQILEILDSTDFGY